MIKNIIALLGLNNFYGLSENIDIAKGKYEIPKTIKEAYKQGLRDIKANKYGRN
jgi:hypothetical protein